LKEEIERELNQHITAIMKENPQIMAVATKDLGVGNRYKAIDVLVQRCIYMWSDEWQDQVHVFQLVMTNLIHTEDEAIRARGGIQKRPAVNLLEEIREILPKYYINIPADKFEFTIRGQKVVFVIGSSDWWK